MLVQSQDYIIVSNSEEETRAIAKALGSKLSLGCIITLDGDLGAGKTTFSKGLIASLAFIDEDSIQSPTFTYVCSYELGANQIHHFDLYRINSDDEFEALGFLDYFNDKSISIIEWPSKISKLACASSINIRLEYLGETQRKIIISTTQE